jgi:hypothetical protein
MLVSFRPLFFIIISLLSRPTATRILAVITVTVLTQYLFKAGFKISFTVLFCLRFNSGDNSLL